VIVVYRVWYPNPPPLISVFEWTTLAEQALDLGLRFRTSGVRSFLDICRDSADWPARSTT
jgi:hypothetical protein